MKTRDAYPPAIYEAEPDLKEFIRLRDLVPENPAQALREIEGLADRGSAMSMLYIADALRTGSTYQQDLEKAEGWYRHVVHAGLPHGAHGLGLIHRMRNKYSEAMEEFEVGVQGSFAPSMNMLGLMYFNGEGVEKDILKAKKLWRRALDLGNLWSKQNLARACVSGKFGVSNILYGIFLFLSGTIDIPIIVWTDRYSDRLR